MANLLVSDIRSLVERQMDDTLPDVTSTIFLDWLNFINNEVYFILANQDENRFTREYVYDVQSGDNTYALPSDCGTLVLTTTGVYQGQSGNDYLLLRFDTQTGAFTAGLTLTGGTSAATGVIDQIVDNGTTGYLILSSVVGSFDDNEIVTDSSTGSAAANGEGDAFSKTQYKLLEQHPYSSDEGFYLTETNIIFTPIPSTDKVRVLRYLPNLTQLSGNSSETLFNTRFSNAILSMTKQAFQVWDNGDIATASIIASSEMNKMLRNYTRTSRVGVIRTSRSITS